MIKILERTEYPIANMGKMAGLPHSAHAICCLLFILQSEIETKIGKENVKEFIEEKINLFSLNNKKIN